MSDAVPLDSAMDTGQGADDEPALAIGDKVAGEPNPDTDGDGTLTVQEAETLLGGSGGDAAKTEGRQQQTKEKPE